MPSINTSQRNTDTPKNKGYPDLESHLEKILIVIKTSPNPSIKYTETVCTAGITENGKWIRIYPLPLRYMDFYKRFTKYQWINVHIKKRPLKSDFRTDSYEPDWNTIQLLDKLQPGTWTERKKIVIPTVSSHFEEIKRMYDEQRVSLGVFKPKTIKFKIEEGEKEWSTKHQQVLKQGRLFEEQPKELEKMPYKFSYEFTCNNSECKGHTMQIIDWELSELYRNMKNKYGFSMDLVLEKVKTMWLDTMWGENKDSYLIVGSIYPKPSFNVLGVFWPPKENSK